MSDNPVLPAEERSEFGKGTACRARHVGKAPTVLYGHGAKPRYLDVPGHDLFLIVHGTKNAFVEPKIEDETQLALVEDVQVHPVRRHILHADFLAVKAGEKVDAGVPVVVVDESVPSAIHSVEEFTILVETPATSIPESLKVPTEGVEAGSAVHASDLLLPVGVEVELDPETVIVAVQEVTPEEAEEATEEATAEGNAEGDAE